MLVAVLIIIVLVSSPVAVGRKLRKFKECGYQGRVIEAANRRYGGRVLLEPYVYNKIHKKIKWTVHVPVTSGLRYAELFDKLNCTI